MMVPFIYFFLKIIKIEMKIENKDPIVFQFIWKGHFSFCVCYFFFHGGV